MTLSTRFGPGRWEGARALSLALELKQAPKACSPPYVYTRPAHQLARPGWPAHGHLNKARRHSNKLRAASAGTIALRARSMLQSKGRII